MAVILTKRLVEWTLGSIKQPLTLNSYETQLIISSAKSFHIKHQIVKNAHQTDMFVVREERKKEVKLMLSNNMKVKLS